MKPFAFAERTACEKLARLPRSVKIAPSVPESAPTISIGSSPRVEQRAQGGDDRQSRAAGRLVAEVTARPGGGPELGRERVLQRQRQRRLVGEDHPRPRGQGAGIEGGRLLAGGGVHDDHRPLVDQQRDRFRRLDQLAPGRGLAQRLPGAAGAHQPVQQLVGETVRLRRHQRAAEPDHRADADIEPVSAPPAVAVGDDLLDRLAADRPHPDLHQRDP